MTSATTTPHATASSSTTDQQRPAWWLSAVGYEVYVRSFADHDGDGIGDLPGLRARLGHLADLGVDVVWLTPVTPSPQRDHGYDVSDYLGIEPAYGDLSDLTALLEDAHALGMRVLLDLVPNHTSDQHAWFLDSRSSRDAEHRDFYVWRDPAADGGPPNNWVSHFGGPAWTLDERTGQYYMHLFLPEQPDLNWAEPQVRAAFEDILTTWFERGVDGVRIDVAHSLVEDREFRDNPLLTEPVRTGTTSSVFERFAHVHDLDQPGVVDIYRDWRRIADAHGAVLLGEVYVLDASKLRRYVTDDALHSAFAFATIEAGWDAAEIRDHLLPYVETCEDRLAWPLSSHDAPHAATRFGGGEVGARRALAYLTLLSCLPGVPFLYQGDELGLDDAVLPPGVAEDPIALRLEGVPGRDPARSPMPWEPGEGYGFTTGTPWLPFGANRDDTRTVAAQHADPTSPLERTRALLHVRRALPALHGPTTTTSLLDDGPLIAIERGEEVLVALHVGDGEGEATIVLPEDARIAYATDDATVLIDGELTLPEDAAVIVVLEPAAGSEAAPDEEGTP
jgi:alpha-glucosidase